MKINKGLTPVFGKIEDKELTKGTKNDTLVTRFEMQFKNCHINLACKKCIIDFLKYEDSKI